MKHMKILMISVRSDHGGGPKHLLDLIKGLQDVEIFVAAPNQEPYAPLYKQKAKAFLEVPFRKFSLSSLWALKKFIGENQIDVIHSHGRGAGIYSRLLKVIQPKLKVVHTFHGFFTESKIKVLADKILAPFADIYISVSEDEQKLLQNHKATGKRPTKIIYNGVEIPGVMKGFRLKGLVKLGFIGRNHPTKRVPLLLNDFSRALSVIPNLELHLAGFEKNELDLPEPFFQNVKVLGSLPNSRGFLSDIDIYVSCSEREGLPLTVLEAMAFGVPCFLSDVPGHHYFIEQHAAFGFTNDFIHQLRELLSSEDRIQKMIATARTLVETKHSLKTMCRATKELYQTI
jgi:glycosyltransferase involved in cell wall biosynthesis